MGKNLTTNTTNNLINNNKILIFLEILWNLEQICRNILHISIWFTLQKKSRPVSRWFQFWIFFFVILVREKGLVKLVNKLKMHEFLSWLVHISIFSKWVDNVGIIQVAISFSKFK